MNASEPKDSQSPNTTAASASNGGAAPESSATQPKAAAPDLAEQIAAAKKEAADNYERYVRSVADLDNFRKRAIRDRDDAAHRAGTRILEDLLPVLDAFSLGLAAAKAPNADLKTLVGGISMVADQLKNALGNHGLKEVNPVGQPFDPNLHEAISQQPSATVAEGSVATVVRIGYTLNGRLLRPASVVVSTGSAKEEAKA